MMHGEFMSSDMLIGFQIVGLSFILGFLQVEVLRIRFLTLQFAQSKRLFGYFSLSVVFLADA